jgi:hypothetical protein
MRTNLFGGALLALVCVSATSFAAWDANDKAHGNQGRTFQSNRNYSQAVPQYSQAAPQYYRASPVMAAPMVAAPSVVRRPAAPPAAPQVAATNNDTGRRSFSVEPSAAPVMTNSNPVNMAPQYMAPQYMAPRSYNNSGRASNQPNYLRADTKILGREGN